MVCEESNERISATYSTESSSSFKRYTIPFTENSKSGIADYSVFQSFEQGGDSDKMYGVCGITNTISDMLGGKAVPLLVDAVLLPFNGKIVYDTFMAPYSISFTGNAKESFAQFYKEAHGKYGIVNAL